MKASPGRADSEVYTRDDLPAGWTGKWHALPSGGVWQFMAPDGTLINGSKPACFRYEAQLLKAAKAKAAKANAGATPLTASAPPAVTAPTPPPTTTSAVSSSSASPTPADGLGPLGTAEPMKTDDNVSPTTRRCGTPGCTLNDFHSGMCTSTHVPAKRASPARFPGAFDEKRQRIGSPSPLGPGVTDSTASN